MRVNIENNGAITMTVENNINVEQFSIIKYKTMFNRTLLVESVTVYRPFHG